MTTSPVDRLPRIRTELTEACESSWSRIGSPGTWYTAYERILIATEARAARRWSARCAARKTTASPVWDGALHSARGGFPAAAIDSIHRLAADSGRLPKSWFEHTLSAGVSVEEYVEIVGVIATVVAVDSFCWGAGLGLPDFPRPTLGEPSRARPPSRAGGVWVPVLDLEYAEGPLAEQYKEYGQHNIPKIRRALSLVPDEQVALNRLGDEMCKEMYKPNRALTWPQIELIATTASAANGCFSCTIGHALMLRESTSSMGLECDIEAVVELDDVISAQIPAAQLLARLARAVAALDHRDLREVAPRLRQELGPAALIDAVAVSAVTSAFNRVADATGVDVEPATIPWAKTVLPQVDFISLRRFN
jgi:alkylhydroperoxidase family enzyme